MTNLWNRAAPFRAFMAGFYMMLVVYCMGRTWVMWEWTLPHQWEPAERFASLPLFVFGGVMVTVGYYLERGER